MAAKPIIVRMALAKSWFEAFRIVATPLFDEAVADLGIKRSGLPTLIVDPPVDWEQRRAPCRRYAFHWADEKDWSIGGAWAMLAVPAVGATGGGPRLLCRAHRDGERNRRTARTYRRRSLYQGRVRLALSRTAPPSRRAEVHADPIAVAQLIAAPPLVDGADTLAWALARAETRS